jgi:putative membrane-bound dehydrogenase-like protein
MKRFLPFMVCCATLHPFANGQGADFKINNHTFTVPDGFEIELVAGPPLVDRPIEADFDEQGRLYVTDSSGSNEKSEKQLVEKPHRVVRLEDTNGDGRFDTTVVFADKMMFPEGCMWFDGSLFVGAPPSIWKLTDLDGDGVADEREEWHNGRTLTGCANDMHGPYLGPDGWIYWCKGAFAEQTYTLDNGKQFKSRAAHIFRKRPDGTRLEAVMTGGMDNPVEVAFLPNGERFFTTTFVHRPEAGKRDGLVHAIYGGLYGKVNDVLNDHKSTGDLMPVMVQWGPSAPCGLARYESSVFGPDYENNLFACLFNLHKVTRHQLTPAGATYQSRETDFVTSDNTDFHPTDVLEDADGSLLVVDTGGWYKLCCPTSQLAKPDVLGGIYRVRSKNASRIEDPRGLKIKWSTASATELAKLLDDPRPCVVKRAMHQLAKGEAKSIPVLSQVLKQSTSMHARRNAVWALTQINDPKAREAVHAAFPAGNNSVLAGDDSAAQTAIYSIGLWRDTNAILAPSGDSFHAVVALCDALRSSNGSMQRIAAEAFGRIGNADKRIAVRHLLGLAQTTPLDRVLEHTLIYSLIEIGDGESLRAEIANAAKRSHVPGNGETSVPAERVALIALDQMDGGGLKPEQVTPLLASTNAILRQAAQWIAGHHPEWGEALAGFFRDRLHDSSLSETERTELQRQLAQFARNSAVQDLLAAAANAAGDPARLIALRAMAASGLKEQPASWTASITAALTTLTTAGMAAVREAVAVAKAVPAAKREGDVLTAQLLKVGGDVSVPADVRLDALAAVPGGLSNVTPDLFDFLRTRIDPAQSVSARSVACAVLAKSKLSAEQLNTLAEMLRTTGPIELPKLLPAFSKCTDEALGLKLLAALKESKGASVLRPDMLKPVLTNFTASVQQQADELLASLNTDAAKQRAHLETVMSELKGGDVRRGQAIFNGPKAACASCHAIGYLGGNIGPDLTSIGQVRTERDLLEAILYPSVSFVRSYEPVIVVTKSGDDYSGVLRKDATEEIVIATGINTEIHIARADIVEMRPGTVSVMPQGLDEQLSRQELADLLAFLKNTKWGPQ